MKNIVVIWSFIFLILGTVGCGDVENTLIIPLSPDVSDYQITDTSLSEQEKLELKIEAISEDNDGNKITTDAMSDVIATKEVSYIDYDGRQKKIDNIIFRSFNISSWKGRLDKETTLLARLFIDFELNGLSKTEKEQLAYRLLSEIDDIEYIYEIQRLYSQNSNLFETMYFDKIKILQNKIKSYLSDKQKKSMALAKEKILSGLNNENLKSRKASNDILNLSNGIQVKNNSNNQKFIFANYFNMYYGVRAYNINGVNQDYDYPFLDGEVNIVEPVKGGAAGGLYDLIVNNLFPPIFTGTNMTYEGFDGDLFIDRNAQISQKRVYEVFKNQFGYPTALNVGKGIELGLSLVSTVASHKMEKIKAKIEKTHEWLEKAENIFDAALTLSDLLVVSTTYYFEISMCTDKTDSICTDDSVVNLRESFLNYSDNIKLATNQLSNLMTAINYTPTTNNQSDGFKSLLKIGSYIHPLDGKINNFGAKFEKLLQSKKVKEKAEAIRWVSFLNYIVLRSFYHSNFKEEIKQYNNKYDYTFDEMIFISSYWIFEQGNKGYKEKILKNSNLPGKAINKAIIDYKKIALNPRVTQFLQDFLTSNIKDLRGQIDTAKIALSFAKKIENINTKDTASMIMGSLYMVYDILGKDITKGIALGAVKNALITVFGGGAIKVTAVANNGGSYVAGMFLTPGRSYFMVETNEEGIIKTTEANKLDWSIKLPPYRVFGVEDNGIYKLKDGKNKIYTGTNHRYLIVTGDTTYYKPFYKVYIDGYNFINIAKDMDSQPFVSFTLNVEKSSNDSLNGFKLFGDKNNNFTTEISGQSVYETKGVFNGFLDSFEHIKDNTYSFDLYDALKIEQGGNEGSVIFTNKTRGVFKDVISYKFYSPSNSEFKQPVEVQGITHKLFKVANRDTLFDNIWVERIGDSFRVQNKGDFDICFTVYYETTNYPIDNGYFDGDICVPKHHGVTLSESKMKKYKDGDSYNDLKFIFFDAVAERFFEEEGYWHTKYHQWLKSSGGLDNMTLQVKFNDLSNNKDSDGDGLSDIAEQYENTDPNKKDTDGDGIDDGWEMQHGLDPTNQYDALMISPYADELTYLDLYNQLQGINTTTEESTISGQIKFTDGTSIPNINVKFEYIQNGENQEVTAISDNNGNYSISIAKEDFDNFKQGTKLIIYAYGDGYAPTIREIEKTNQASFNENFVMEEIKENEIVLEIEPQLHHLGDGNFQGSANSDFQRATAEGFEFSKSFYIDNNKFTNYYRAKITFKAKGVQSSMGDNKLFINEKQYNLKSSPSNGSYDFQTFEIDKSNYINGNNIIKIVSNKGPIWDSVHQRYDRDDFEFINIKITFLDPIDNSINDSFEDLIDQILLDAKPIVTDIGFDTNDPNYLLKITTSYATNDDSAIDYVYWRVTSPSGKQDDQTYYISNYSIDFATLGMKFKTSVFDEDGIYTVETYVQNKDSISSDYYTETIYIDVPDSNNQTLNNKILIQNDKWRAKITIATLIPNQKSATIDFRALSCGGDLTYVGEENGGYKFDERITYGNCVQNCQVWIKSDGSYYEETCGSSVVGGNLEVQ